MKKLNFSEVVIKIELDFGIVREVYRDDPEETERQLLIVAKDVARQIERHVDDVAKVHIETEQEYVCSHCWERWEVNYDKDDSDWEVGEPVCCTLAQDEWRAERDK